MLKTFMMVALVLSAASSAQSPVARFEVASVKPSVPTNAVGLAGAGGGGASPNGDVRFTRAWLLMVIAFAYDIHPLYAVDKVVGQPPAMFDARFDIEGKGGVGSARDKLKTLLAERFKLRVHHEVRQVPVYVLTVKEPGKLGPGLKPSPHDCAALLAKTPAGGDRPEPCRSTDTRRYGLRVQRFAGSMNELILRLTRSSFREPVLDRTGLTGNYEWQVAFDIGPNIPNDVPNVFTAFEDQLGLKLERTMGPLEVVVVDDVHMPTAN